MITTIFVTLYLLPAIITAYIIYKHVFKKDLSNLDTRDIHTSLVFIFIPIINITPVLMLIWDTFTKSSK